MMLRGSFLAYAVAIIFAAASAWAIVDNHAIIAATFGMITVGSSLLCIICIILDQKDYLLQQMRKEFDNLVHDDDTK